MWAYIISFFCALFGWCGDESCKQQSFRQVAYTICRYQADDVSVRLYQNDDQGNAYANLSAVKQKITTNGIAPDMLMNGGMYHDDLQPVGLYIENGNTIQTLSTKGGWGNFHLLPNGVFWIKGRQVGVSSTPKYRLLKNSPDFATQSGPMLVINGKLHPRFLKNSDSLKVRNGVGVSRDGDQIYFVISHSVVNFWDFGTLFKDQLKTPNALFLDGSVSTLQTRKYKRGGWRNIGPIIAVIKRPK